MKYLFSAAVLLPYVLAHPGNQIPLNLPEEGRAAQNPISSTFESISEQLKSLPLQTQELWDDISKYLPKSLDELSFLSKPKPSTPRPDSHWDYHVKGAHVETLMEAGERKIHGDLEHYRLRGKAVDPSKLNVDPGVKQYSGYLDNNKDDKHLFYWFFESRSNPKTDPVVLWLNGGPGCSSLTGLFMELGPSSVKKDGSLKFNPYAWNNNASVIFLDQPVNVGYSYSNGQVSNTVAAGKDVYALMTLFFEQFPEYATQDFHIAGESYAGHYIPVFATEIMDHKKRNINLKSVLIGNGLTDGLTQYEYYEPMACGKGGYPAVLTENDCAGMKAAYPRCASMIENCYNSESVWSCVPASIYCNNQMMGPYQRTGTNVYDIRGPCKDSSNLCYPDLGWISAYLNKRDVMEALGVEVSSYDSCNFDINRNFLFQGDWMKPFHRLVPGLLEKIPVLIYAGDADFICNHLGNHAWTEALEWPGKKAYNKEELGPFTVLGTGKVAGSIKSSGNFTFLRIFEAGHMTPMDQPEASMEFFNRWLSGEFQK